MAAGSYFTNMEQWLQGLQGQADQQSAEEADQQNDAGRRTLLGQGYQNRGTIDRAQGRYDQARDYLSGTRGRLQEAADGGLYNDREDQVFEHLYGNTFMNAANLSETGGISNEDARALLANMDESRGYARNLANNGIYSANQIRDNSAAAGQQTMDQWRAAAGSAQSRALASGGGGIFAGSALLGRGASERGKAMAATRLGLEQENAQSRMSGMELLQSADQGRGAFLGQRGANMVAGQNSRNNIMGLMNDRQTANAQGRQDARGMLMQSDEAAMGLGDRYAQLDMRETPGWATQEYDTQDSGSGWNLARRGSRQGMNRLRVVGARGSASSGGGF